MPEKAVSRDVLMESFGVLQRDFERQRSNVLGKESEFDLLRQQFTEKLSLSNGALLNAIAQENPLRTLVAGLVEQFGGTFARWEQQVAARAKGTRFREGFGDSLLVFIYGKVKSGKSSLGNYVAWGHSEPSSEQKQQILQPVYFSVEKTNVTSGDKDKEAENQRQFRVGATEATSSIQGFRLPGLTWVDSPGLHSVNACNGDLAKEYVEHADLILYTMNSHAPGRASDMAEIKELLDANKKIMVLLTGSDTTEEDEDADGNLITTVVMKSGSDRQQQVSYVRGELQQLSNNSCVLAEVLPISTRYAERNLTPEGLVESGMGRLMSELQSICTSQALSIKLNAPMDNLRNSIQITANDLAGIRDVLDGFSMHIEKQHAELDRELNALGVYASSQMRVYINELFNSDVRTGLEERLRQKAGEIVSELAMEVFQKIGEGQRQRLRKAFDSSRLGTLPEYREITEEKEYFVGTRKGNKGLFGGLGAVLGGTAGFLLGGPAGAVAGAALGSAASAAGRSASAEYARHQVVVGDNREEQRQAAIECYAKTLPALLRDYVGALYDPLYSSMQSYCQELHQTIGGLIIDLERLEKGR